MEIDGSEMSAWFSKQADTKPDLGTFIFLTTSEFENSFQLQQPASKFYVLDKALLLGGSHNK